MEENARWTILSSLPNNVAIPAGAFSFRRNKMRTIWKFRVKTQDRFYIDMPKGAIFLYLGVQFDVAEQAEIPYIWCEIPDTEAEKERKFFYVYGTGNPIGEFDDLDNYVDSWQQDSFVWHLFGDI